ncbi:MAG: DUF302 domain-containing protein [Candidatus Micrarchaeales archaeon]|uniref:DUF302 domain-containing protein n=1 Tax=Candidatus Micrarchaeum acidiphilum ARMAN-2 TaxID=425595 RepID=C7DHE2_MICA2|nr:MAG: protein of unknown function DUF302 [Candidatus Micrarchaeum acidiphilum ARMAN-2]MCW6160612.1 DUF302 domain-containing protein [Candidatus Micrarchaeales archaeon]
MAEGIIKVRSEKNFDAVLGSVLDSIRGRGIKIFGIIDHRKNAEEAGMELGNSTLVIFGNPKAGTKLMQDSIGISIDLPMRILVSGADGDVTVSYYNPLYLAKRHDLKDSLDAINSISGLMYDIAKEAKA